MATSKKTGGSSKWKAGVLALAAAGALAFSMTNGAQLMSINVRDHITNALGMTQMVADGDLASAPKASPLKSSFIGSLTVGMSSAGTGSGMKNIAAAWSQQTELREVVLGSVAARWFEKKHSDVGHSVSNLLQASHIGKVFTDTSTTLRGFAPDSAPVKHEFKVSEAEKPMTPEQGRVATLNALANEALHNNAFLTAMAIPGSDKSAASFPEAQRDTVRLGRDHAASAFRHSFVSAIVALSSQDQAEKWGLPSAETLKQEGYAVLDSKKLLAETPKAESQFGPAEMALAYAARSSKVVYEKTVKLSPKEVTGLKVMPHYPDQPALLYNNYAQFDAKASKTDPSAVLNVSQNWVKNNPTMAATAPIKAGVGWRKALDFDEIKAGLKNAEQQAIKNGPSEAQKVSLEQFRAAKAEMMKRLDEQEALIRAQNQTPNRTPKPN